MMKTATLPVKGLNFAGCAREIEKNLSKLDGIAQVEASYVSQTVTVTYDENTLSDTQLRGLIKDCGFLCGAPWSETSNPGLSAQLSSLQATMPHAEHMPAMEHVDGHSSALVSQPSTPHTARSMEGMEHEMGETTPAHAMGSMEHDMSNPAMAKQMEADMRNRFFVSLVLTIPVILYSPLGVNLFKLHLPTPFDISPNWILFILATPIVWWGGWIFHSGAWRALRNRTLDMNVLVSLGVLVAYFFSVYVTFFCSPGRDKLRRGSDARNVRALRSLDGDAQSPWLIRRAQCPASPCTFAS
jgi:P-type Cu2+ transporter